MTQPEFHMPGWPEMRYHGAAKTDGSICWWEETMPDGSVKRHPLQPVMRAAENAAKVVDTWSTSKRQYAERVMGGPALTKETVMTNEQIAQRAVDNAETAAQVEIKDSELRDSLIRNFIQELDRLTSALTNGDRS